MPSLGVPRHGDILRPRAEGRREKRSPCHLSKRAATGRSPPPQCRWRAFENPQFRWEPQTCEKPELQEADFGSLRVKCWFAKRTAPCRTWQKLDRPKPNILILAPEPLSCKSLERENDHDSFAPRRASSLSVSSLGSQPSSHFVIRSSSSLGSSCGSTGRTLMVLARPPCFRAFSRAFDFPLADLGPVLRAAFFRFALICASLAMVSISGSEAFAFLGSV